MTEENENQEVDGAGGVRVERPVGRARDENSPLRGWETEGILMTSRLGFDRLNLVQHHKGETMPDLERWFDDLALHLALTPEQQAYEKGFQDGKSLARKEMLRAAIGFALGWILWRVFRAA